MITVSLEDIKKSKSLISRLIKRTRLTHSSKADEFYKIYNEGSES